MENVSVIDTDAASFTTKADHLHFDANGQQALGATFAVQVERKIKINLEGAQ